MRKIKKQLCAFLAIAMAFSMSFMGADTQAKAKKMTLKTKKIELTVGKKKTISIKNKGANKVTFKSANKKIASVSKKGVVKALKKGSTKITVSYKLKKKTKKLGVVSVKVLAKKSVKPVVTNVPATSKPAATSTPAPTSVPTSTPYVDPTKAPSAAPSATPTAGAKEYIPSAQEYDLMVEKSLVSTGNNARIKSVIEKARKGEEVSLGFLGGSITDGEGANPNSLCYAERVYRDFQYAYSKNDNVKFINAGQCGTPSSLGILRYDSDILGKNNNKPVDILFIEFSVNDPGEITKHGAYEGLIRKALNQGSAVVMLYSSQRFTKATAAATANDQADMIPLGEYYELPQISMSNAMKDEVEVSKYFINWYWTDSLHPNNTGYMLMNDCIMNMFKKIDAEELKEDGKCGSKALFFNENKDFGLLSVIEPNSVKELLDDSKSDLLSFDAGSFTGVDTDTGKKLSSNQEEKFPSNFMRVDGNKPITMVAKCQAILFAYKQNNDNTLGILDVYVDGVKTPVSYNGYNSGAWGQGVPVLIDMPQFGEHKIEFKMAEGSEEKNFTMYRIGYIRNTNIG